PDLSAHVSLLLGVLVFRRLHLHPSSPLFPYTTLFRSYFWVVTIAVEAIAGAAILVQLLPMPAWLPGTGLILATMLINLLSVRVYGEAEFWLAALKVVIITAFIVIGALHIFVFGSWVMATWAERSAHGRMIAAG